MSGLEGSSVAVILDTSIARHLSNLSYPFIPVCGGGAKPLCKPGLFLEGCTARDTLSLAKVRGHQMVLTFLSKAPCRACALSRVQGGSREGRNLCVFAWLAALTWGLSLYKEDEDTAQG